MPLRDVSPVEDELAATFGIERARLWDRGVHVTSHVSPKLVGWGGTILFVRDERVLVSAPPEVLDASGGSSLAEVVGSALLDGGLDIAVLRRHVAGDRTIIGPSRWGFVDELLPAVSAASNDTRRIELTDLAAFRDAVGEADWSEAGFDHDPHDVFALERQGEVVAAANLTSWRTSADDVGVCVHPDHRGTGFGERVARAAVADAIAESGVCRYRALTTNVGSLRIADRLGVVGVGLQYAVV